MSAEKKFFPNPTELRFRSGTYILLWFTNPDKRPNPMAGMQPDNYEAPIDDKVEQGLCSQFFTSLEDADGMAKLLSGSRMILMCTAQNPQPSSNVYWSTVRVYGEPFQLNELTVLPEEYRKKFIEMGLEE